MQRFIYHRDGANEWSNEWSNRTLLQTPSPNVVNQDRIDYIGRAAFGGLYSLRIWSRDPFYITRWAWRFRDVWCCFWTQPGGDIVWNIGTGYFGCRNNSDGTFDPEKFKENACRPQVRNCEGPRLGRPSRRQRLYRRIIRHSKVPRCGESQKYSTMWCKVLWWCMGCDILLCGQWQKCTTIQYHHTQQLTTMWCTAKVR